MKTSFILIESENDPIHIVFAECDNVFQSVDECMDWCMTSYPFLRAWKNAMEWNIERGEETCVFVKTKSEGYKTLSVTNSVTPNSFNIPIPDTYNDLSSILRLFLGIPTVTISYRVLFNENMYELVSDHVGIHSECHGIYLECTDDFYIVLQGVSVVPING
jgi:hypothetical protein